MIKHIVMWKLKENHNGKTKITLAEELKKMLEDLKNTISEIKHIEAGINIANSPNSFDVVLYSEFKDELSLANYKEHPDHVKVAEHLSDIKIDTAVVDFQF